MKIRTKTNVTHLDIGAQVSGGSKQGIVSMNIRKYSTVCDEEDPTQSYVEVAYGYYDEDGNLLPSKDGGRKEIRGKDNIIAISIQLNTPNNNSYDKTRGEVELVAKIRMAETFNTTVDNLEVY